MPRKLGLQQTRPHVREKEVANTVLSPAGHRVIGGDSREAEEEEEVRDK